MKTIRRSSDLTSYEKNSSQEQKELHKYSINTLANRIIRVRQLWGSKSAGYWLLPILGSSLAVLGGCSMERVRNFPEQETTQSLGNSRRESDRPLTPTEEDTNFVVDVVERVKPVVVQINTARTVATGRPEALDDPTFRRFFGDSARIQPQERVVRGIGRALSSVPTGRF
jgi:S1-C subfamily serine protease